MVYLKRSKSVSDNNSTADQKRDGKVDTIRIAEKNIHRWQNGSFDVLVNRWGTEAPHLLLYKKWQNPKGGYESARFRINSEDKWLRVKLAVDGELARHLGWSGFSIPKTESGKYISVEEHQQLMKRLERENKKKSVELMEMEKTIARTRRSIRKELEERYRNNIPDHRRALAKFKKMIDANETEQTMHPFLREHYWIFGTYYLGRANEPQIGFLHKGDFMLLKENGYNDLVELKCPGDSVFTKRDKLSAAAKDAISQMITYLHKCDLYYHDHLVELGVSTLKPQGFIVIGRRSKSSKLTTEENLQIHNAYLSNITLMTFDQLYENAMQTIRRFEGKTTT